MQLAARTMPLSRPCARLDRASHAPEPHTHKATPSQRARDNPRRCTASMPHDSSPPAWTATALHAPRLHAPPGPPSLSRDKRATTEAEQELLASCAIRSQAAMQTHVVQRAINTSSCSTSRATKASRSRQPSREWDGPPTLEGILHCLSAWAHASCFKQERRPTMQPPCCSQNFPQRSCWTGRTSVCSSPSEEGLACTCAGCTSGRRRCGQEIYCP